MRKDRWKLGLRARDWNGRTWSHPAPGIQTRARRASGVLLVVDERGRVEDEASFGRTESFFRVPALGALEARPTITRNRGSNMDPRDMAHRFLIASVFKDH